MASWTTPTIPPAGGVLSQPAFAAVANNTTFLYQTPYGLYYNSSSTSIVTATTTQVTLGGTLASNYGFSLSSNSIIVPLSGVYHVSYALVFTSGSGVDPTYTQSLIYQNGTAIMNGSIGPSDLEFPASTGSGLIVCTGGDAIALYAYQNSGSTLDTDASSVSTYVHMFFVGST